MTSILRVIMQAIQGIMYAIARLLGMRPPANTFANAPIPNPADDIRKEMEGVDAGEGFAAPKIGVAVHAYAAADDGNARSLVDLSALSVDQLMWLTGLSFSDLRKLAAAGPAACERAASGRKCGVVGLPLPGRKDSQRGSRAKHSQADAGEMYSHEPEAACAV